ncbi:MAG: hypothetical protein GY723_19215 [bacterium]|nr:hypothetical protein [bacterium]
MGRALYRVLSGTLLSLTFLAAGPAASIEFFDGRFQVNGFYEAQIRAIARDFDASDDFDLTQLAHVLNLEFEASLVEKGWGPFDIVSAYSRVEIRYDCVWTRACGVFPSVNAFGDGAKKVPKRLNDGRRTGYVWNVFNDDTRFYRGEPPEQSSINFRDMPRGSRRPYHLDSAPTFGVFFNYAGIDDVLGTEDDTAPYVLSRYFRGDGSCKLSSRQVKGSTNGSTTQILGFLDPGCEVTGVAAMIDRPNPFRPHDINPITGHGGAWALPYRPAPPTAFKAGSPDHIARGLWLPRAEMAEMLRDGKIEDPELNFSQNDLAWNHGASQGSEQELKELYLDIEMFDARLWLRLGKQAIVWGKTELFRSQDQFNPQDFALASLPSLEESRIALWAARGVWSFYEVGPFQDVRLELAVNYDQVEPNDLGVCGEPYALPLICVLSFATAINSFEGVGIAGVQNPPDPWNSWKGIEVGARLEWRWKNFSFALTDFYGYDDMFYIDKVLTYERNVDPETGRPRRLSSRGNCRTGAEDDCLRSGEDSLYNNSANRTMFDLSCAANMGMSIDPAACGLSVFNSKEIPPAAPIAITLAESLATILAGDRSGLLWPAFAFPNGGTPLSALVRLNRDANDGPGSGFFAIVSADLMGSLTDQQEALFGCGAYFETSCDLDGIDLLNAEASALGMSFVGMDGTSNIDWDTTDRGFAQPGTIGFEGGPVCTRYERGRTFILPGCRGPGDAGYNPAVDGTPPNTLPSLATGLTGHPFTGQKWDREVAALSWNFMMLFVALSAPVAGGGPAEYDEFDERHPLRKNGCSFAKPQLCKAFSFFLSPIGVRRNVVKAGGNGRYGRRDFLWHAGSPVVFRYEKRNVLGFSMDFAEDYTGTNWNIEATWLEGLPFSDNNEYDGLRDVDTFNLTVSVDRPTFVNFLNANRTFFINSQWFFQYVDGYRGSFTSNGPWNVLATLTVMTGYFQDRLLPSATAVYDFNSNSGAFMSQVTYRYTGRFSATFGVAGFFGRFKQTDMPINEIALQNRVGKHAYKDFGEGGLSMLRNRDEIFLRLRYTF